MRVRYFGTPWPSPERRAPICDDDKWSVPIERIAGRKCLHCTEVINDRDRGVITACSPNIWGHFRLRILLQEEDFLDGPDDAWKNTHNHDEVIVPVAAHHLRCWMEEVVGEELSATIMNRMHLNPGDVQLTTEEIDEMERGPMVGEEDAEPGGWREANSGAWRRGGGYRGGSKPASLLKQPRVKNNE